MTVISVENITKSFGDQKAVNGVTFSVEAGEMFGLLGPNGAGKTTTIRIILDLFRPDSGQVAVLGGAMTEAKKERIGYLPEERGLYQEISLENSLVYLSTLKGLSRADAKRSVNAWLERFDLAAHRKKKVKELSKGMQQKAQLIATLAHRPSLIIIDEPFSGLDPVNTQMVKDILQETRREGATVVMCTHQMHQVEALCDRLVLISHGQVMLYGTLEEIRHSYARPELLVRASGVDLSALPGVQRVKQENSVARLLLEPETQTGAVLAALVQTGARVEQFEVALPTLDEIFISVVQGGKEPADE